MLSLVPKVEGDPIFFEKRQLRVGMTLVYYGRTNPNSRWIIDAIYTGVTHRHTIFPETLKDLVQLTERGTGRRRLMKFGYLSYSAIWRLDT